MPAGNTKSMDDIMALCKRRGFIFQASEIYGGINGFWDYGPLGAQLKKNLRDAWWQDVVMSPCWGRRGPDGNPVEIVPLDTCIIQNPKVWEASGHVAGFNDPMVDDKETKQRFRADHLIGLFVRPQSGVDTEWVSAQKDLLASLTDGTLRGGWSIIKTAVGSVTEAFDQFARAKRIGKHRVIEAQQSTAYSDGAAAAVAELSLIVEDGQGTRCFAQVLPVTTALLTNALDAIPSPFTDRPGNLMPPRAFNLMFDTITGAIRDEANKVYLRPETAQGIFVNFKNVVDSTRVRLPFGIAQTGKAFRNEVTPRNFTFRSREFEQMEIEFFCHESQSRDWYAFWRDWRMEWWQSLGLAGENLQLREHDKDELAHYAKTGAGTSDVEYRFPFTAPGFGELEGIAHRGNFDLTQHQKHSGVKMDYFDTERGEIAPNGQPKGERYIPHCVEPSAGLDRGVLAILCEAFTPDETRPSGVYMKFHPRVSPIKAAVFPLVKKDGMPEVADKLTGELRRRFGMLGTIETDEKQSIGKRYARMDEAGCPFCFTIDGDTLADQTVTVRHRDTQQQERIGIDKAPAFLAEKLGIG